MIPLVVIRSLKLPLAMAFLLSACGSRTGSASETTAGTENGDGDGDGDGDGTSSLPDLGDPHGCGDGSPEAGEFCFETVLVPEFSQRASAAGSFQDDSTGQVAMVDFGAASTLRVIDVDPVALDYETVSEHANGVAAHRLYAVDLDGDGDLDVLETSFWEEFGVSWNDGLALSDLESVDLQLPGRGHTIPLDIDGDGVPELLKGDQQYGQIGGTAELFARSGVTWLHSGQSIEVPGCGSIGDGGGTMAIGTDLDGDGSDDLVLSGDAEYAGEQLGCEEDDALHEVRVHFGESESGLLGSATTILTGQRLQGLHVGDFDGDGQKDILVLPYPDGDALIVAGAGNRSYAAPMTVEVGVSHQISTATLVGDFDGDGLDDFAQPSGNVVEIHADLLGEPSRAELPSDVHWLVSLGDINADGVTDFIGKVAEADENGTLIFVSNP